MAFLRGTMEFLGGTMEFLEADHEEWSDMWEELANYPLNEGDPICQIACHTWEYMGTDTNQHHFRHPLHPRTGKVEYVWVERRRAAVSWAS